MKIIHCADLHLDPPMTSISDREKAAERRRELLLTLERLLVYADENGVGAIIIAGDLFDRIDRSSMIVKRVASMVGAYPHIRFYYASGNHDPGGAGMLAGLCPDNLRSFDGGWHTFTEAGGRICLTGAGQTAGRRLRPDAMPEPDPESFNIVILHGQISSYGPDETTELIDLDSFAGKGIDYLALGHIHAMRRGQVDGRGIWCYPGCLEGRGFDECGEHGFVLLDIDEASGSYSSEFIPFASRMLYSMDVDVGGCSDTAQMLHRIGQAAEGAGCSSDSLVRVRLTGLVDISCEKDTDYIRSSLGERFYYVKVEDETGFSLDTDMLMGDMSLRGEFVRQVMADPSIKDEDRPMIIRYGIMALDGTDQGW